MLPAAVQLTPSQLRRRARSNLVDAFRLYALPQLKQRLPKFSYYAWVIESMLRRASLRLEELASSLPLTSLPTAGWRSRGFSYSSFWESTPADDSEDLDCDTDDSSLRTPSTHHSFRSSGHFFNPFEAKREDSPCQPFIHVQYHAYSGLRRSLEHLLHVYQHRETDREREEKEALALLEVRSRRRAWFNNALSVRGEDWGLAGPFAPSPLGK